MGIDHGFSFPLKYFEKHRLPHNWDVFVEDFERHWPTNQRYTYVDFVRDGVAGAGHLRMGMRRWAADVTEERAREIGLPLRRAGLGRQVDPRGTPLAPLHRHPRHPGRVHFWPFDGWDVAPARSAIVEVYPRLWKDLYATGDRNPHQQDAFAVASWLRDADADGRLSLALLGPSDQAARKAAVAEGWILGVE